VDLVLFPTTGACKNCLPRTHLGELNAHKLPTEDFSRPTSDDYLTQIYTKQLRNSEFH